MHLTPVHKTEKSTFLCEMLYHKMNSKMFKNNILNTVI